MNDVQMLQTEDQDTVYTAQQDDESFGQSDIQDSMVDGGMIGGKPDQDSRGAPDDSSSELGSRSAHLRDALKKQAGLPKPAQDLFSQDNLQAVKEKKRITPALQKGISKRLELDNAAPSSWLSCSYFSPQIRNLRTLSCRTH